MTQYEITWKDEESQKHSEMVDRNTVRSVWNKAEKLVGKKQLPTVIVKSFITETNIVYPQLTSMRNNCNRCVYEVTQGPEIKTSKKGNRPGTDLYYDIRLPYEKADNGKWKCVKYRTRIRVNRETHIPTINSWKDK